VEFQTANLLLSEFSGGRYEWFCTSGIRGAARV